MRIVVLCAFGLALLGMLNSCASNVTVVNIDNGLTDCRAGQVVAFFEAG